MVSYTLWATVFLFTGGLLGFAFSRLGTLASFFSEPVYRTDLKKPLQTVILISFGYLGLGSLEVMLRKEWAGGRLGENWNSFPFEMLQKNPLLVLAFVGVVAPVLEEILARGYFLEFFNRFRRPTAGIVLSSVFFGFAHWPHPLAATFFGVSMCYLKVSTGSLAVPIAAHMGVNSLLLTLAFLSPRSAGVTPLPTNQFEIFLVSVVNAIMIAVSFPVIARVVRYLRGLAPAIPKVILILISVALLISAPRRAYTQSTHRLVLPENVCRVNCTTEMKRISDEFDAAHALSPVTGDQVYSGTCYMRGDNYNPETAHHGIVYFDYLDGRPHNHGQFAFFNKENPYRDWSAQDFRSRVPLKYSEGSVLHLETDYAWVDYQPNDPVNIWQYFYRQAGTKIFAIAYWGRKHTLFCELNRGP